jgi:hypothetical protein
MGLANGADNQEPLTGTVEVDETYTGGKYDKRRKRAKDDKEPVFRMVSRDGKAKTYHIANVKRHNVIDKIKDSISIEAPLVRNDGSRLYDRMPASVQKHEIVNRSAKEWVSGDVHTCTIDGYRGLLKRGIIGSLHQVSVKHLHRYLSELQFRWNNRKAQDIFLLVIAALAIGRALPCKALIASIDEEPNAGPGVELDGEPF